MIVTFIGQKGIPCQQGGPERYVEDVALGLVKAGHEVNVYYRSNYVEHDSKSWNGVNMIKAPHSRIKAFDNPLSVLWSTIQILFRKTDVIHYQAVGSGLWIWIPRLFKPKVKIIISIQDLDWRHGKWGIFARFILKLGARIGMRMSHKVLMVSEAFVDEYKKIYGDKVIYVPNSINIKPRKEANIINEKWGLKEGGYFVSISRLVSHKGIHFLIKAFRKIKTDKKLVIVGGSTHTDDYVNQLKELAKGDDRIIFTGVQKGEVVEELFSNAYTYVQPSFAEGLSLSLLEAMSYALPIISSDIIENKIPLEDGAKYFKAGDVEGLRERMEEYLAKEDDIKLLGVKAKQRVVDHYSLEAHVKKLEELYTE